MLAGLTGLLGGGGGGGSAFESIASVSGSGSSASVTFNSIPSTFKSLQIRWMGREDIANAVQPMYINFNGSSSSIYAYHGLRGDGDQATASGAANATSGIIGRYAGDALAANCFGVGVIDIIDYASTTKNKTALGFTGVESNVGMTWNLTAFQSTLWASTAAITSITLSTTGGNWITSSKFALYGIKG